MAGITISSLSKSYGGRHLQMPALQDLDLAIHDNQFITLLGPSGCGKTTTLRLIAGYVTPDTGSIHVGDRLVSSPAGVVSPEARGMGMVFQNYAVWPHKTVYENIAFGLKLRKLSSAQVRDKVEQALVLVNLKGLEARFPNELSGGQQQRVALARSLVVEPDILLLDEPLSNLDAKLREKMRSELKQLQRRTGITFIYVTHDQSEALALSDQIAVMHAGRLQQFGSPFEVYNKPANRVVADFMGLVNLVPGRVRAVSGETAEIEADGGLVLVAPRQPGIEAGAAIEIAIRPENIRLTAEPGAVNGTVTEQTFLGNICEYLIALPGGRMLRVQTHPLQQFPVGQSVGIVIDPSQCSQFPREQGIDALASAA